MSNIFTPYFAGLMLWLIYLMLAVALGATAFSVVRGISHRSKGDEVVNGVHAGRIGWCVAIALVVCMVATFLLGSPQPVMTNGISFDNAFWLKVTDMFVLTSILLIIVCFASTIVSRFRS